MSSTESSSGSGEEEEEHSWAEKKRDLPEEDWLGTAIGSSASFTRDSLLSKRDLKLNQKRAEEAEKRKVYLSRELNPFMRNKETTEETGRGTEKSGGSGGKVSAPSVTRVDHGVSWLQKAYDRIHVQAKEQGKSPDEVAAERWGSLAKLKESLEEAKEKLRQSRSDERGETREEGRPRERQHSDRYGSRYGSFKRPEDSSDGDRNRREGHKDDRHRRDHREESSRGYERERNSRGQNSRDSRRSGQGWKRPSSESTEDRKERQDNFKTEDKRNDNETFRKPRIDPKIKPRIEPRNEPRNEPRIEQSEEKVLGPRLPLEREKQELIEPRDTPQQVKPESTVEPNKPLTESEKNAIHAKILKAEMLGNTELVKQLKEKLAFFTSLGEAGPRAVPQPEENVKYIKVAKRVSEDAMNLRQMFVAEKRTTADDDAKMFVATCSRSRGKTADDEYDLELKAKKQKKDGDYEIVHEKEDVECSQCLTKVFRNLLLAVGENIYLCLPQYEPLVEGHCFIRSRTHGINSFLQTDEDMLTEISSIKNALTQMHSREGRSMIFMETYYRKNKYTHHFTIECLPVKSDLLSEAQMYYKKAIMECEAEWSLNKKLVELNGKCVTRMLPQTLSYFWVTFGPQNTGYGHVIEDEEDFSRFFGHEILGGLLDIEPRTWKKPKSLSYDQQFDRINKLKSSWSRFNPLTSLKCRH